MKNARREYVAVQATSRAAAKRDAHLKANPEMMREHVWHLLPVIERRRALCMADIGVERAIEPLASFSDAERMKIRHAVERHMLQMSVLVQCVVAVGADSYGLPH